MIRPDFSTRSIEIVRTYRMMNGWFQGADLL